MSALWTVFSSQEPVGLFVTGLILILFAVGAAEVFWCWFRLSGDWDSLRKARENLPRAGELVAAGDPLQALECPAESLLGERIARVLRLRAAGLGHRELLERLTIERVDGYGSHARFIATVLTMLGLLGTVAGMSLAMLRITGAFHGVNDVKKLGELTAALGGTLEGMKTAFACTLAGLTAAVALSFLSHLLRRRQSSFLGKMEEFVTCELLPVLERTDPESNHAAKAFATVLGESSARIGSLSQSMNSAAERYEQGSRNLERMVEALNSAMTSFASSVTTLTGNQTDFTGTMAETRAAVQSLSSVVQQQLGQIQAFQEGSQKLLAERLAALESGQRANVEMQRSIQAYHDKFQGFVTEAMKQLTDACQRMLQDVNQNYRDGVAGHVDRSHQEFKELLQEHAAKLQSFANMMLEIHINGRSNQAVGGRP